MAPLSTPCTSLNSSALTSSWPRELALLPGNDAMLLVHAGHKVTQHSQKTREDHRGGEEQNQYPSTLFRSPRVAEKDRKRMSLMET